MVVVDEDHPRALPSAIEMCRAALSLMRGDRPATVAHARHLHKVFRKLEVGSRRELPDPLDQTVTGDV